MESTNNKLLKQILKGTMISILGSLVFLIIFAIILTYTKVSEETITPVIIIITGISILIGSIIGSRKIRKNGILVGGIVRTNIYSNTIFYIKSIKRRLFNKHAIHNHVYSSNYLRNDRRHNRSKQQNKVNHSIEVNHLIHLKEEVKNKANVIFCRYFIS